MADPDPFDHPLGEEFVRFMNSRYMLVGITTLRVEFPIYLAGVEAGIAQERDNARRDSAAARPHTDRANAAAVERLCATMRGLPAAPGWRVTTVWGTFDAG
jgi:hypothetical protein